MTTITDTIGDTTGYNGWQGYLAFWKITASSGGTLQTIGINLSGGTLTGSIEVGIYSNISDSPGSLIGSSALIIPLANGRWNDISVSSTTINTGSKYWLVFQVGNVIANFQNTYPTTGSSYYNTFTYNAFPVKYPGGYTYLYGQSANMRMTYTSGGVVVTIHPDQLITYHFP